MAEVNWGSSMASWRASRLTAAWSFGISMSGLFFLFIMTRASPEMGLRMKRRSDSWESSSRGMRAPMEEAKASPELPR